MERLCIECGDKLLGRIDKKFCSDACRNSYNNRQRIVSPDVTIIQKVNKILARNRNIMSSLNPRSKMHVHRSVLLMNGFDFSYFTNRKVTRSGRVYYYCYDQGYCNLGKNSVMLVKRREADQHYCKS